MANGVVWVADGDYAGHVFKIDALTGRILATIRAGGLASGIAAGAGAVWVSLADRDAVLRIDPATDRVAARIAVGAGAFDLAVAAGRLWVANDDAGTVSEIDVATNRVIRSAIHVGTRAAGIAATSRRVYVSDPGRDEVVSFAPGTPDRQTRTSATGHPVHLIVGDTLVWALGDHRLTGIPAR